MTANALNLDPAYLSDFAVQRRNFLSKCKTEVLIIIINNMVASVKGFQGISFLHV